MILPSNSAAHDNFLSAVAMTIPSIASESSGSTHSWPPYSGYQAPTTSQQDNVSDDDPVKWVSSNWENVTRRFPNQWIVVEKGAVVAHSETVSDLREQIRQLGIECPFITKTGRGPIVWKTAYGRY